MGSCLGCAGCQGGPSTGSSDAGGGSLASEVQRELECLVCFESMSAPIYLVSGRGGCKQHGGLFKRKEAVEPLCCSLMWLHVSRARIIHALSDPCFCVLPNAVLLAWPHSPAALPARRRVERRYAQRAPATLGTRALPLEAGWLKRVSGCCPVQASVCGLQPGELHALTALASFLVCSLLCSLSLALSLSLSSLLLLFLHLSASLTSSLFLLLSLGQRNLCSLRTL